MNTDKSIIWLHGNHRVMWLSLLAPAFLLIIALIIAVAAELTPLWLIVAVVIAVVGLALAGAIVVRGRLPRIVLDDNQVLFYLPGPQAIRVPLEFVECCFLGSGITELPGSATRDIQTRNLVVRFAERATEWQHRELPLSMGKWCEGYLTIRGLYCEPLDVEVIKRLNTAIHQAQNPPATQDTATSKVVEHPV